MNAIPTIQPSFAAGELSPFLYGRVDLAKFRVGARTLENFFVHAHGGASNRPGTRFIGEVGDSTQRHRLIPFQFRTLPAGQTYVLVFGHHTMQVAMNTGSTLGFIETSPGARFTLATPYAATRLPAGLAVMSTAGVVAGVAGASGGFIKTPATTEIMGVPVKVAASTTTFTVGITSAAALIVFAIHGRINLDDAAPVVMGSLAGGQLGARLQARFSPQAVRTALAVVLVIVAGVLVARS